MAFEAPSALESVGIKPHILTGAFVQIIRNLFSTPENIEASELKNYIWTSDKKLSKILIQSIWEWEPENIQQRPSVVVKRGAWKIQRLSISDKIHGPPETTGFTEDRQVVAVAGSHIFFCLGNSGTEAEHVGTEVYQCLLGFSSIIREQLCLGSFQVVDIGEVAKFEESHDHFIVPVSVAYGFYHIWNLIRQAPEWMRVGIKTETSL